MSDYGDGRPLDVIHFTLGATDPIVGRRAHGVRVVVLADGGGADETYVSCLHFEPGGWVTDPPAGRDVAILAVQGAVILHEARLGMRLDLSPGVGVVMNADVPYRLESEDGGILLTVESERLEATECGISTPERIMGQLWPGEVLREGRRPRSLLSLYRWISWHVWLARPIRRPEGVGSSGWRTLPRRGGPVKRVLSAWARRWGW